MEERRSRGVEEQAVPAPRHPPTKEHVEYFLGCHVALGQGVRASGCQGDRRSMGQGVRGSMGRGSGPVKTHFLCSL